MVKNRRRAARIAEVDYDRTADSAATPWDDENPALDAEREVLRIAGNMSAPTVLFVLERLKATPGYPVDTTTR